MEQIINRSGRMPGYERGAMTSRMLKRAGLTLAAMLALCALTAAAASAATPHWVRVNEAPNGSPVEYSGENTGNVVLDFAINGGEVTVQCQSLSTAGEAENPAAGKAGTISAALQFSDCTNNSGCRLEGDSVDFEPLQVNIIEKSGEEQFEYRPKEKGGALAVMHFNNEYGQPCGQLASAVLSGKIFALPYGESWWEGQGSYEISGGSGTELKVNGYWATLEVGMHFATTSEEPLTLSSEWEGIPRWFLGDPQGIELEEGVSTAYSSASMSFSFYSSMFWGLIPIHMTCDSSLEGAVENPTGGGAGVATGDLSLDNCVMRDPSTDEDIGCEVTKVTTEEISGAATDAWWYKTPAVKFSSPSGTLADFYTAKCGESSLSGSVFAAQSAEKTLPFELLGEGSFSSEPAGKGSFSSESAEFEGSLKIENAAGEVLQLSS